MEAPKEIYVEIRHPISHEYTEMIAFETPDKDSVKYIRADLAELTWDDIRKLFKIADNYESELNRPKYLTQGYCEEILSRFMESKKATRL